MSLTNISSTPTEPSFPSRRIRCLLFDVGDTLWMAPKLADMQSQALNTAADARVMTLLERSIPAQRWDGIDRIEVAQHFRSKFLRKAREYTVTDIEYEPNITRVVNATLQDFSLPPLERSITQQLFENSRIPLMDTRVLFPDALSTLQQLRARGYQLGIVTNRLFGGETFVQEMQATGLLEFFIPETLAVSADLGIRKPHPEIFRYALDRLQVDPAETVMVGDNLAADIFGGSQLHMLTAWLPPEYLRTRFLEQHGRVFSEDREAFLEFAFAQRDKERRHYPAVRPDYILDTLGNLLDIFSGIEAL